MASLLAGICLWMAVHFVPGLSPATKTKLVAAIGLGPYRGAFAILILTALTLIILGWRSAAFIDIYQPAAIARHAAMGLMVIASCLLVGFALKTNIKRIIRHPQLTAVAVWALAHLLANGDGRSILLFGGLGLWAVLEMLIISRREGSRTPPAPVPFWRDMVVVAGGLVVFAALLFGHPYFTGMSVL